MLHETPIYMIHDLKQIPQDKLPNGYQFRKFDLANGDDATWAEIVTATNEFASLADAIKRFNLEFRPYPEETAHRLLLLETSDGHAVGTICAWYGPWQDETIGRLHWVEIHPHFQGKKLGRPMIAKALQQLAKYHTKAYLSTQESSGAAIHLYRQFGFQPCITTSDEQIVWDRILVAD